MKKILLVYANPLSPQKMHLPYGLLWIRQNLSGFDVKVVDPFLEYPNPEEAIQKLVSDYSPDLVGIGVRNLDSQTSIELHSFNYEPPGGAFKTIYLVPAIARLVSAVKKGLSGRDVPMVVGGGGYQSAPRAVLEYLDLRYGIVGPGERALLDFINQYFSGGPLDRVPGLIVRESAGVYRENPRTYCGDNFTQFIRFPEVPENLKKNLDKITVGVKTRYGCTGGCNYCLDPIIEGAEMRYRDMDDIFRQLLEYAKEPRINKIHFTDPEFNVPDTAFSAALLKEIIRRGFDFRFAFSSQFTAGDLTPEFAGLLYKARLRDFSFTVDSVSDDVLKLNSKRYTRKAVQSNIDACLDNGIFLMIDIIAGMRGENRRTMEETVAFCKSYEKAPLQFNFVHGLRIYEKTPLGRLISSDYARFSKNVYGRRTFEWMEPCYYSETGSPYDNFLYFREHLGRQKNVVL